jgi:ATP-dependent RNA helicase RhlE
MQSQNARQTALNNFKSKVTRVLVATDIAARGIDIDDLTHVINYDLPNIPESYVHRIGRTGRAGAGGTAIAFCDAEEKEYLRDIQKLTGKQITVAENVNYPMMNHTVVKAPQRAARPSRNGGTRNSSQSTGLKSAAATGKSPGRQPVSTGPVSKKRSWYSEKRTRR